MSGHYRPRAGESLGRSDATLTEVASEEVRGVATTHYRVDVDGERLDARFADDMFDDRELVTFDVWVDRDRRLRRAEWVLLIRWGMPEVSDDLGPIDGLVLPFDDAGAYRETTTVELWDYGVPVDVQAPPADEVCDVVDLFGRTLATFDDP